MITRSKSVRLETRETIKTHRKSNYKAFEEEKEN